MSYGVTPSGFVIKPLNIILEEIRADLRSEFGDGFNLDPQSPEGIMVAILAERESLVWELMQSVYLSQYPHTSEGVTLDNAVALTGISRKGSTFSTINSGRARGDLGTIIPSGTVVSVDGNPSARFETTESAEISIEPVDEVQTINLSENADDGEISLSYDGQVAAAILYNDSPSTIASKLNALPGLSAVSVSGMFSNGPVIVTFAGADGGKPQPLLFVETSTLLASSELVEVTIVETTPGDTEKSPLINMVSQDPGSVSAPTGSLTVIETPVIGLDSFVNESPADIGNEEETDAELKLRREEELAFAGAGTLDSIRANVLDLEDVDAVVAFENDDDVEDDEGRPPHSVDIIVMGGAEAAIATALFKSVAAGITYFGSTLVQVEDSQGFPHDIRFSRPVEVPLFLILDLTTDSDYPVDGDDVVKAAMIDYVASLKIGEDVIVFGSHALIAALSDIPGITDVVVRVGTAEIPANGTNTVTASNSSGELLLNWTAHTLEVGNQVKFTNSGGALPTGLTAGVTYWVVETAPNSFKVSTTRTGDPVAYTNAGTGTHTVHFGGLDENIVIGEREIATILNADIEVNS